MTIIPISKRYSHYDKDHCWQYDIRLNNLQEDIKDSELTIDEIAKLSVKDFEFVYVTDKIKQKEMTEFIKRHEWLGTLSLYTTHWFACYYKDILAGVILFNMPNAFSKIVGDDSPMLERLISRGACISWSPKNLASAFLMWSIKWMVANTRYRVFIAYSDPSAKELGTIYQACNFYYMGNKAGGKYKYINPYTGKIVSDRFFRVRSAYKKYAIELGLDWKKNWCSDTKMLWENIPDNAEEQLRAKSKSKQAEATKIEVPSKHKYVYILGRTKKETKQLKEQFFQRNKIYDYPKERGI